jgi:hypothetical protein
MDWDYHTNHDKNEQIKTTTEQDTPQDKERLKITPLKQENQDKEQHRRATTSHTRKAIPKEQQIDRPRLYHNRGESFLIKLTRFAC